MTENPYEPPRYKDSSRTSALRICVVALVLTVMAGANFRVIGKQWDIEYVHRESSWRLCLPVNWHRPSRLKSTSETPKLVKSRTWVISGFE